MMKEEQSAALLLLCAIDYSKPHCARVLCRHVVRSYFTMDQGFTMATPYEKTLALIDEAHAQDPKKIVVEE